MNMTESERLEASAKFEAAHRRLWSWLAENPEKEKWDWPEWTDKGGTVPVVVSKCFACHACGGECCPLDSKAAAEAENVYDELVCLDGLYHRLAHLTNEERAKRLRIIADLPWNPDKVTMPWPESVDISGAV